MHNFKYMVRVSCMTYNHASYIVDALNGFCIQKTSFPFVCTVVDDASIDGAQEVIWNYIKNNFNLSDLSVARREETCDYVMTFAQHNINHNCFFAVYLLKYNHYQIKKPKVSYLSHWNDSSKYVAICEGDDYWIDQNKLERQVVFLENNPEYVMSHTSYRSYFESSKRYANSKDIQINRPIKNPIDVFRTYRIRTLTVVMRADVYKDIRSADPFLFGSTFLMGDGQLWYEMARKGKIHFIPEVMCVYRVHDGSASRQSVTGAYRFALSCAEMQLYLTRRDNVSDRSLYEDKYKQALFNYLLFEPHYERLFESEDVDKMIQSMPLWKLKYKKYSLLIKFHLAKIVGRIQKYFIKSY